MGALDSNGIYIYDETDDVATTWSAMMNLLGNSASDAAAARPTSAYVNARFAAGSVTMSVTSLASGTGTYQAVTFGKTLSATPRIVVSFTNAPAGSAYLVPRALAASTTGFNLYLYNLGTSAATVSGMTIAYHATVPWS